MWKVSKSLFRENGGMVVLAIKDVCRCVLGPIKRWINRNKCLKNGSEVKIQYSTDIINVTFAKHGFVAHDVSLNDVNIGDYTSIGRYTKIRCADIGKYCSISWDVTIGAVEHPLTRISTAALTYKAEYNCIPKDVYYPQKRTVIGNDVWIGCNVVIKSGVKVGDGAVIGAGSVVIKDIEPYSIVAGNPAKEIRKRTDDELIERLLNLNWWNWSTADIKSNIELFDKDLSLDVISRLEEFKKTH